MISRALDAKRCNLDNGNAPIGPNLADADAADAEGFMAHILRVLPLIGISAFEEKERKLQARERVILTCAAKKKGVIATGYVQAGGFVVCKDSLADPEEKGGMHDYMRSIRRELLEKQILVQDGTLYRFTQDYDLSSPSTAAGVVLGRAANGRTEWIDTKSKKTLKALQEEEAGE